MKYRNISELSFLTKSQKEYFDNYILYEDGTVFNNKTGRETAKTKHGIRGYVVNLARHIDGKRKQKQILVARALYDLFVNHIKESDIIEYIDKDKENIKLSNLKIKEKEDNEQS